MTSWMLMASIGAFSGLITAFFFLRDDKDVRVKLISWAPPFTVAGISSIQAYIAKNAPNLTDQLCAYFVAFLLAFVLCIIIYWQSEASSGTTIGSIMDGSHLRVPRHNRILELEQQLTTKELSLNSQQTALDEFQNSLDQIEKDLKSQLAESITIPLIGRNEPVTQHYINHLHFLSKKFFTLKYSIAKSTDHLLGNLNTTIKSSKPEQGISAEFLIPQFIGYISEICAKINAILFVDESVRTHFRIYHHGEYVSLLSVTGLTPQIDANTLRRIPFASSMISRSFNQNGPAIASRNRRYHWPRKTSFGTWKDYITIALHRHLSKLSNNRPMFAFGISVTESDPHKYTIIHLCHNKIDDLLHREFERIYELIPRDNLLHTLQTATSGGTDAQTN